VFVAVIVYWTVEPTTAPVWSAVLVIVRAGTSTAVVVVQAAAPSPTRQVEPGVVEAIALLASRLPFAGSAVVTE
jgi:hypothetical protein